MPPGVAEISARRNLVSAQPRAPRLPAWTPWALALLFALLALRGIGGGSVIDTDAARHAMNGAFIHDLLLSGRIADPIQYGKEYYGRLPALSMPYHPPLFPAIEALFYFVFGVNLLAARLAVAVAVGASAVLLYRLVQATHGSDWLALAATVTTLSLVHSQQVATDVMLEYPAMAFSLAALYCLRDLKDTYPLGRALWFAVLGGAAVWTKQFAVFLLPVPALFFFLTGRWRLLFSKSLWISSALFALAVQALTMLSAPFNHIGVSQISTAPTDIWWIVTHNLRYYGQALADGLLGVPALFALAVAGVAAWMVYRGAWRDLKLGLYLAWIVAISAVLLVVGARSSRYLFFVFPPVLVAAYVVLLRGGAVLLGEARARRAVAAFAALWLIAGLLVHPEFLHGPSEAASIVARSAPARVLYAGDADGNFIFALRSRDSHLDTTVIPGQKLPPTIFTAVSFEDFCRRYAIGWIVLEETSAPQPWSGLPASPAPSMQLARVLPLDSSRPRWRGRILLYRFTASAAQPEPGLELPLGTIQGAVEVGR